jgi:FkbM family methyltransferase
MPTTSYAWHGEDICIGHLMLAIFGLSRGFYVDIGAHHPFNLSNTAILYAEGWRGINIDAAPGSMDAIREHRPEDINLEIAIAAERGIKTFYCLSDGGLSGFLSDEKLGVHKAAGHQVIREIEVGCTPINDILSVNVQNRNIDLLNIDTEGYDEQIIRSLDLSRWRPTMIAAEILEFGPISEVMENGICRYLEDHRTAVFALSFNLNFHRCSKIYRGSPAQAISNKSIRPSLLQSAQAPRLLVPWINWGDSPCRSTISRQRAAPTL